MLKMTAYALNASRYIFRHVANNVRHKNKVVDVCSNQCKPIRFVSSSYADNSKQMQQVSSIDCSEDGQFVTVSWQDGRAMKYPYIWLRDNCRCSNCYDPPLSARKYLYKDLNLDAKVKLTEHNADGELVFHGTDGHQTTLQSSWLRHQDFGTIRMGPVFNKVFFGSDLISYLPKFEYEDVLNDDKVLYRWMECVKVHGVACVRGAPTKGEELTTFADRIGHIRQTFYGVIFGVKSKQDTYFPGYTADELPLHTDYTFGFNVPRIVMFHGIERAPSGGLSMFVDGFKVANDLKESDPAAYQLLRTGQMSYGCTGFDCGRDFDHLGKSKIINVDIDGVVDRISFSQHVRREGLENIPLDQVRSFYEAVKKYASMVYSQENIVKVMIEEGDIVTLDNYRVLHGRESFGTEGNRGRIIHGAYFDNDDFESRLRILSQQQSTEPI